MDHDWHLFDVERGYEVKRVGDRYLIRKDGDLTVELSEEEFDQLRAEGPNPRGLE